MKTYPCHYCARRCAFKPKNGVPMASRDHVWPQSKMYLAPPELKDKTVIACVRCNTIKADLLPLEFQHLRWAFPRWWTVGDISKMQRAARMMGGHCLQSGCKTETTI